MQDHLVGASVVPAVPVVPGYVAKYIETFYFFCQEILSKLRPGKWSKDKTKAMIFYVLLKKIDRVILV